MRKFLMIIVVLLGATALALPPELANTMPTKIAREWRVNVPAGRQTGDTVETPFMIEDVPYAANGTTAGFNDDYDVVCPFTGSTAPDVVYRFEPAQDMLVDVDLCGSDYDTKVYIYDGAMNVIACNDDAYYGQPCGYSVSLLSAVPLTGNQPYFIVIDGFRTEFGGYELAVRDNPFCALTPCFGDMESEPPLQDGYVDQFNGGCNSSPEVFGIYAVPLFLPTDCLNGITGWYQFNGSTYRDTDWYMWPEVPSGRVTFTLDAELPTYLYWLDLRFGCESAQILGSVLAGPCSPASITVDLPAGDPCWLWIGPQNSSPPNGSRSYQYDWQLHWTIAGSFEPDHVRLRERERADCRLDSRWCSDDCYLGTYSDDFSSERSCDGPATPGPDGLVAVYLEAGDELRVDNDPIIYPAAQDEIPSGITWALLSDLREEPGSCLGAYEMGSSTYWTVYFTAEQTGWHYLVVDCLLAGVDPEIHFYTFHPGHLPPTPPPHDLCVGARVIPHGEFSFADDLTAALGDYDPGEFGTYGRYRSGRDVVYQFEAEAGTTLAATMTGNGWDEELYVVSDCENSPTTVQVVGAADGADGVHLEWAAPAAGTYWLICDSFGLGARPFTLSGSLSMLTSAPTSAGNLGLEPGRPNPFNSRTTIAFTLPAAQSCRLAIYSLDGRRIRTLVDGACASGRQEADWDGRDQDGRVVPSGAYFCRLEAGDTAVHQRLTLLK